MEKVPSVVVGEPTLGLTGEKVHQAAKLHGKALLWQSLFLLEGEMCSREGEVTCDKWGFFFKKIYLNFLNLNFLFCKVLFKILFIQ
jgi:hypothetical protein